MKQKLALAVALVRAPALPSPRQSPPWGVDPLSRALWAVIRRMVGQGRHDDASSPPPISRRLSRPTRCSPCRRVVSSAQARPRSFSGHEGPHLCARSFRVFSDAEEEVALAPHDAQGFACPESRSFSTPSPATAASYFSTPPAPAQEFAERARSNSRFAGTRRGPFRLRRSRTCAAAHGGRLCAPHLHDGDRAPTTPPLVRSARPRRSGRLDTGDVPIPRARSFAHRSASFRGGR